MSQQQVPVGRRRENRSPDVLNELERHGRVR